MSALNHVFMIRDRVRCEAYQQAIAASVRPGDVVLDLGSGTGLLAYFALQAGAAHVYAIEHNAATLEGARALAAANGFADRITWLHGRSTELTPPARMDGLMAELFGVMGLEEDALRYLTDARERWLRLGGWMVPQRFTVQLAPVTAPKAYAACVDVWTKRRYGIRWSALREQAVHTSHVVRLPSHALLAPAQPVHTVDLMAFHFPTDGYAFDKTLHFMCERAGLCHGLGGWFTAQLVPTVALSTAPDAARTHWDHRFFPLAQPVAVQAGDRWTVQFGARPLLHQLVWHWEVVCERAGRPLLRELHSSTRTMGLPSSTAQLAPQAP